MAYLTYQRKVQPRMTFGCRMEAGEPYEQPLALSLQGLAFGEGAGHGSA
jgi:hypothetical protein